MSAPRRTRKAHLALGILVCLVLVWLVQIKIDALKKPLKEKDIVPTQLPQAAAASAALGGFKGIAVDLLWIQSDSMINNRQYYQLTTCYELIAMLQPNFPTVWIFNAWNLAYNISVEWGQPDEQWIWIKKGLDFEKEGLRSNPESEELYYDIGALYLLKIGKNAYFSKKCQEQEGVEPFYRAYECFKKAADLGLAKGELDVRSESSVQLALFMHGLAVKSQTGNVPEAMRFFNQAEEGTRNLLVQFPGDAGLATLLERIRQEKARLTK